MVHLLHRLYGVDAPVANCGEDRSFHFTEGPVLIRASSLARQSHLIAAGAVSSRTSGERCSETSGRWRRAAWLNCASTIVAELRNHTALERRRAHTLSYSDFQLKPSAQGRGKSKGKVFPYSLPSVGPGADPGVQAVSPQVT